MTCRRHGTDLPIYRDVGLNNKKTTGRFNPWFMRRMLIPYRTYISNIFLRFRLQVFTQRKKAGQKERTYTEHRAELNRIRLFLSSATGTGLTHVTKRLCKLMPENANFSSYPIPCDTFYIFSRFRTSRDRYVPAWGWAQVSSYQTIYLKFP